MHARTVAGDNHTRVSQLADACRTVGDSTRMPGLWLMSTACACQDCSCRQHTLVRTVAGVSMGCRAGSLKLLGMKGSSNASMHTTAQSIQSCARNTSKSSSHNPATKSCAHNNS
eukprot:scaffold67243_cov19-Tisochrysis_lutea.AAC.1